MGAPGGGAVSRMELCREASPAAEGGRAGKKMREKGRKVCIFYMLTFSSFFCASLQTQKWMALLCISLCIYKKEKNVDIQASFFQDGSELVFKYEPIYDVLLLDIEMPKMNGVDALMY